MSKKPRGFRTYGEVYDLLPQRRLTPWTDADTDRVRDRLLAVGCSAISYEPLYRCRTFYIDVADRCSASLWVVAEVGQWDGKYWVSGLHRRDQATNDLDEAVALVRLDLAEPGVRTHCDEPAGVWRTLTREHIEKLRVRLIERCPSGTRVEWEQCQEVDLRGFAMSRAGTTVWVGLPDLWRAADAHAGYSTSASWDGSYRIAALDQRVNEGTVFVDLIAAVDAIAALLA